MSAPRTRPTREIDIDAERAQLWLSLPRSAEARNWFEDGKRREAGRREGGSGDALEKQEPHTQGVGANYFCLASSIGAKAMYGPGAYFAESCTKADEYAFDEPGGYYDGIRAMLLCRVCILAPVKATCFFPGIIYKELNILQ